MCSASRGEPVGEVDHRVHARAGQRAALPQARHRLARPRERPRRRRRSARRAPAITASAAPAPPSAPGDADEVARQRAVAPDELLGALRPADGRDRDRQRGGERRRRRRAIDRAGRGRERDRRRAPARAPASSPKSAGSAQQRGRPRPASAPIAARSESAPASARWPTSAGLAQPSLEAEVDALDHRVDARSRTLRARARPRRRRRPRGAPWSSAARAPGASPARLRSIRSGSAQRWRARIGCAQRCR